MASSIKSSFVFFLLIINVIGVAFIYLFLYFSYDTKKRSLKEIEKINHKRNNLKISTEILLNNEKINNMENLHNNTYSYSKEDKFNTNYKVKLKKRRLSYRIFDFFFVILTLNSLSAFFCLIILFSFFVKNEERNNCCCYRSTSGFHFLCFGYYRCDHDLICFENDRGQGFFLFMLFLMVIFFFFISIFFIARFLGKNLSRYISLVSFIIFNLIKILKCVTYIKDNNNNNNNNFYSKNILIVSAVLIIFNISGVLLPNLKCFKILRKESNKKVIISLRGNNNSSKSVVNNLVKSTNSNNIVNAANNSNYNNNNTFPIAQEQSSEKNENINNSFSVNNKSKINEKTTNIEDVSLSIIRKDFSSDRKTIGNLEESTKI